MPRGLILLAVLLVGLAACGRPGQATPPATATSAVAPGEQVAPTSGPQPTFGQILLGVSSPTDVPTVASSPLVVSPVVTRTIDLQVGGQTLTVELASTGEQRQRGLMFREQMPEMSGMLFVFPNDQQLSFWMRDTLLPLSIAFIDAGGTILNIEDMQPLDEQNFHMSRGPARYALEVNQGWFTRYGVQAGDKLVITLPPDLEIR